MPTADPTDVGNCAFVSDSIRQVRYRPKACRYRTTRPTRAGGHKPGDAGEQRASRGLIPESLLLLLLRCALCVSPETTSVSGDVC